jgi:hypothetical protein
MIDSMKRTTKKLPRLPESPPPPIPYLSRELVGAAHQRIRAARTLAQ